MSARLSKPERTVISPMPNLFDEPGRPFGYAHVMERTKIEDHLIRKSGYKLKSSDVYFRVVRIQERIHKYDETFATRSRRWRKEQEARIKAERAGVGTWLTWEQLERLVEHFAGANDPVSAGIAEVASKMLADRA